MTQYPYIDCEQPKWHVIEDITAFELEKVEKYHPADPRYLNYWREEKKRCIEGLWRMQFGKWMHMPGCLYFYGKFGILVDTDKYTKETKKKKPFIHDLEWESGFHYWEARGFSGYIDDDEYTSSNLWFKFNEEGLPSSQEINLLPESTRSAFLHLINKEGKLKKYKSPRENLRELKDKPLGRPLFHNDAQNTIELGSRGGGKSYKEALMKHLYNLCFDGAVKYEIGSTTKIECCIGSADTEKSGELVQKIVDGMNEFAVNPDLGAYGNQGDSDWTPNPFYRDMSGPTHSGNKKVGGWRHSYEKKVKGRWVDGFGTGTRLFHVSYSPNKKAGAEAGAGGRYNITTVEEMGLCFGKNTKVRMYDGSVKNIQDIKQGELVMGQDGSPRTVCGVTSGKDTMYKVSQTYGDDYIVNSQHPICTKIKKWHWKTNKPYIDVKEIKAEDFNNQKYLKTIYGYKNKPLSFKDNKLPLDSYYLGLWIGDGSTGSNSITIDKKETEIINYIKDIVNKKECDLTVYKDSRNDNVLTISPKKRKGITNYFTQGLKKLGIFKSKAIPMSYIHTSKEKRLKLLAGLLDSDGCYVKTKTSHYFEFYQTNRKELINQVRYLCSTLGLKTTLKIKKDNKGYGGKILKKYRNKYTIKITGDIYLIPTITPRKKAEYRKYLKDHLNTSIKVSEIGEGTYYGFTLKEDPYFLLKDGTVVHNTGNVIEVWNSNEATVKRNGTPFGVQSFLGTSGHVELIIPTNEMFTDPKQYRVVAFKNVWESPEEDIGFFLPAYMTYRQFKDKNGNTDVKKAREFWLKGYEEAAASPNPKKLRMYCMNYPDVPSHMWINDKQYLLPYEEATAREKELLVNKKYLDGKAVRLTWNSTVPGGVDWEIDDNADPFYSFPIRKDKEKIDGAIVIYKFPEKVGGGVPNDMYFFTHDPYVSDNQEDGASLGVTHVFMNPKYSTTSIGGQMVATYIGKPPGGKKEYYQNLEKLLAFYGNPVRGLAYEANKGEYCRSYFEKKGKLNLLALRPQHAKGDAIYEQKISKFGYLVGASGSIGKVTMVDDANDWLLEDVPVIDSEVDYKKLIETIPCIFTIRQIIQYNLKGNFDAVSSLLLAPVFILEQSSYLEKERVQKKTNKLLFLSKKFNNGEDYKRKNKSFTRIT